MDRRSFFKTVGLAMGTATMGKGAQTACASHAIPQFEEGMSVLVDIPKCIGCRRCEFACKEAAYQAALNRAEEAEQQGKKWQADGLREEAELFKPEPEATFEDKSVFSEHRRPEPHCHTTINRYPNPADPEKPFYGKYNCLHCNDPGCVSACLVGAFQKTEEGPVLYDAWKCMGCRYCMVACPFGIPTYEYENPLTPQVRKCTLCADEGNPNKGQTPACIKICPAEVMSYGKREDMLEMARRKIAAQPDFYEDHIYGEHEAGGTAWLYLAPKGFSFSDLGYLDVGTRSGPRSTEKIQHGVFKYFVPPLAWYGLLGAMMYVTRPNADGDQAAAHGAGGHEHGDDH